MKILDRYLLKQFLSVLLFALLSFWIIFLIVDLVEHIDTFIDRKATISSVVRYYLFYSPYIVVLISPVAMLLSSLFSTGLLSRQNELLAMKSSGISLQRILFPIMLLALFISSLVMLSGNLLIPYTNQQRLKIRYQEIEKKTRALQVSYGDIYLQTENDQIIYLNLYNDEKKEGSGVLFQTFKDNRIREEIRAEKILWQGNGWVFLKGIQRIFSDSSSVQDERYLPFERILRLDLKLKPEILTRKQKTPEEMSYQELKNYVKLKQKTGQDAALEKTDLYMKLSFPLANIIIVLFGCTLATRPRRSGLALSFAISLGISFLYYTFLRVGQSFGYSHRLPPLLAAWIANLVFGLVGIVLLFKAKK
ncbi:MAG: LPS export ABC transporter permease LptG [candidate division Zixibacteria bacterium]|nr:LPS export ABC transporter permease LptG [candidate division Zixibacteria bacterium]